MTGQLYIKLSNLELLPDTLSGGGHNSTWKICWILSPACWSRPRVEIQLDQNSILHRKSFYISTTWWVSLLVDQWVHEGTCSQVLRSTSVDSWSFESIKIFHVKIDWNCNLVGLFKNWMFNFVSLLKYKRQMTGNNLCKPAQRSRAGLHIICYPSFDVYTSINWQN